MKLRSSILFTMAPWLFYFAGEMSGHLALGSGSALLAMLFCQSLGWYRLKWTDWTQFAFFTIILLAANWPPFKPVLVFRPELAPGLFLIMTLGSLAMGHPFTNQFAREQIPADFWDDPAFPSHFARVNRILTFAWGINFGVALACAWIARRETSIPPWTFKAIVTGSFIAVGALTRFFPPWYEKHVYLPHRSIQVHSNSLSR